MGYQKQISIQIDDYNMLISQTLFELGTVAECPFCHIGYLTGKNEDLIYGTVTNAFKKQYGENYDNFLMRKLIKCFLDERFYEHKCNED